MGDDKNHSYVGVRVRDDLCILNSGKWHNYKYTRGGKQALIGTFPFKEKNSTPTHPPHVQALQRNINIWTLIKRTKRSRDSTEYVQVRVSTSPCLPRQQKLLAALLEVLVEDSEEPAEQE